MNQAEQASKAEAFRALHRGPRLLLMANAWDAITARLFEAEGFAAVATPRCRGPWSPCSAVRRAPPRARVLAADTIHTIAHPLPLSPPYHTSPHTTTHTHHHTLH